MKDSNKIAQDFTAGKISYSEAIDRAELLPNNVELICYIIDLDSAPKTSKEYDDSCLMDDMQDMMQLSNNILDGK